MRERLFLKRWCSKMQTYLDNSATTRICPEALEAYTRVSLECFGNPSSLHGIGHEAEKIIDSARHEILSSVGTSGEVIFTASGSEANNLAIIGRARSKDRYSRGAKIITTMGEHASVDEPLNMLESEGFKVARIPTLGGEVDLDALREELTDNTVLVSVMLVNNETGAVYDIPKISSLVKARCRDALIHVDATQGYMKIPFTLSGLGADMVTLSSHKIEGPKGVGALVMRDGVMKLRALSPVIFGGGQEKGLRSGTENVPGIAAFGEAVRVGREKMSDNISRMSALRERLIESIRTSPALSEVSPTLPKNHAPHILNVTLPCIKSETMLHFLSSREIYVSSGSACSSNTGHTSSALTAYGRSEKEADSSIRISLSGRTTEEEIDAFVSALEEGVARLARVRR